MTDIDDVRGELTAAARVLRTVATVQNLLAFPATYVQEGAARLRAIARYTNGALMPWEPEWGPDLRTAGIREVSRVVLKSLAGGEAVATASDVPPGDVAVIKRQIMLYEAAAAVNFGCSMRRLWMEAGAGNEGALFRLVQLDKSFLTMPWCQGLIKRQVHLGDWAFFERLGKAVAAPPLLHPPAMVWRPALDRGLLGRVVLDDLVLGGGQSAARLRPPSAARLGSEDVCSKRAAGGSGQDAAIVPARATERLGRLSQ